MKVLLSNYRVIFHSPNLIFLQVIIDLTETKPIKLGRMLRYFEVPYTMIKKVEREFGKMKQKGYIRLKFVLKDVRKITLQGPPSGF